MPAPERLWTSLQCRPCIDLRRPKMWRSCWDGQEFYYCTTNPEKDSPIPIIDGELLKSRRDLLTWTIPFGWEVNRNQSRSGSFQLPVEFRLRRRKLFNWFATSPRRLLTMLLITTVMFSKLFQLQQHFQECDNSFDWRGSCAGWKLQLPSRAMFFFLFEQ